MKLTTLTLALVALVGIHVPDVAFAHGGQYRGPGDTVPPGGSGGGGGGAGPGMGPAGPNTPGGSSPTSPGAGAPGAVPGQTGSTPVTGSVAMGADLTAWSFWWEFNKEPYLQLKSAIHGGGTRTGSQDFWLGKGVRDDGSDTMRPTEQQIRQQVVPALLAALENETNNDIVTGCLIALAKIGDENSESGESAFEAVIAEFLSDSNQEIRETAAVALGILANPASVDTLMHLLQDSAAGRRLTGSTSVNYRTRSFAAYGLGLIGADPDTTEAVRQHVVQVLHRAIEEDDTKSRDLRVSGIISMGLVPLATIEPPAQQDDAPLDPAQSRVGQLTYLLEFLRNEDQNYLVRAHCPTALARLLGGLPAELRESWNDTVKEELIARAGKRSKDPNEIKQSAVLALGLLGDNGDEGKRVREVLSEVPQNISDQQARNFSMIAMGKAGGRPGEGDTDTGIREASSYLLTQLSKGKSSVKPWAGLALGVLGNGLRYADMSHPALVSVEEAVRASLEAEKDRQKLGAYAISAGIMRDVESLPILLRRLERESDDEARGYLAVSLGLMGEPDSIEPIQEIVRQSKYRPDLLKQAAIGLGLLGDKDLVLDLVSMLSEAKGLATQAAISSALGFIGDQRSIDPLVEMLANDELTDTARGFAAVALGIVADKEPQPWNSKIAVDLNYRASTETLTSLTGTGILDIL